MSAAAAVKSQDKLAALGLDGSLASQQSSDIRAKENIYMNSPNHNNS
jgi:hypothetical protein